jgi:hypothetical protein
MFTRKPWTAGFPTVLVGAGGSTGALHVCACRHQNAPVSLFWTCGMLVHGAGGRFSPRGPRLRSGGFEGAARPTVALPASPCSHIVSRPVGTKNDMATTVVHRQTWPGGYPSVVGGGGPAVRRGLTAASSAGWAPGRPRRLPGGSRPPAAPRRTGRGWDLGRPPEARRDLAGKPCRL